MPRELARTRIRRRNKARKHGLKNKNKREVQGTTMSFPLEGPIPSLRYGRPINADLILVPADLLK